MPIPVDIEAPMYLVVTLRHVSGVLFTKIAGVCHCVDGLCPYVWTDASCVGPHRRCCVERGRSQMRDKVHASASTRFAHVAHVSRYHWRPLSVGSCSGDFRGRGGCSWARESSDAVAEGRSLTLAEGRSLALPDGRIGASPLAVWLKTDVTQFSHEQRAL